MPITDSGRDVAEAISSMFERGSVARENCAGLAHAIEFPKNFLLQRHPLENRFDHHVDARKSVKAERGLDSLQAFIDKLLGKTAALHRTRVILLNISHATIERRLVGILEQNRNAGIGEHHRNAAAHRSRSHDGRGIDRNKRSIFRNVRNLPHFALAEEDVNQRLRLIGEQTFDEKFFLLLAALVERQFRCGFHGVNRGERCDQPALFRARHFASSREYRRILFRRTELFVALAGFRRRLACDFPREFKSTGQ